MNIIQDIKCISRDRKEHYILIIGSLFQGDRAKHFPTIHCVQHQAPHSSSGPDGIFSCKISFLPKEAFFQTLLKGYSDSKVTQRG